MWSSHVHGLSDSNGKDAQDLHRLLYVSTQANIQRVSVETLLNFKLTDSVIVIDM